MAASQFWLNIGKIPVSKGDYYMQVVYYSQSSQQIVQKKIPFNTRKGNKDEGTR